MTPDVITLTQDQYNALCAALEKSTEVTVKFGADNNAGTLVTSDVNLQFSYSPNTLIVDILQKKSLAAKFAPDSVIYSHINELLQGFINT